MPEDKKPDQSKPEATKPEATFAVPPIMIRPPIPPTIFINLNPTISSLSPVGSVVGGGDFTLAVFGTNFNANSVVNWNQLPRPTTFVSSNQVNAQIAAADISVVIPVTVSVTGSNGVAFNVIPDIGSIVSQLQSVAGNPAALLAELNTWVTLEQAQVDSLTSQVNTGNTSIATLQSQVQNLNTTVTQQANTISQLQAALAASKGATASPLDVAQSFKSVVDQIQQQARDAGGVQTTLTNMNVQLKTLISVQPQSGTTPAQAILGFPDLTAPPDPNLLSTMTLAFGAIPNVKPPSSATPSVVPGAPPPPTAPVSSGPSAASNSVTAAPPAQNATGGRASSAPPSPVPQTGRGKPQSGAKQGTGKNVPRSGKGS